MEFKLDFEQLKKRRELKPVNLKVDGELHEEFKKSLDKLNISSQKDFFEFCMSEFNKFYKEKEELETKE